MKQDQNRSGRPMMKACIAGFFLLCLFAVAVSYGFFIEPYRINVHQVIIKDEKLGPALSGSVAVLISDLHMAKAGTLEQSILRILETIRPDMVFICGDYVKWNGDYEGALDFLAKVKAKGGVWAVMGDYDYSNSRKSCLFCHEPQTGKPTKRYGVKFLKNSLDRIDTPHGPVWIAGIDTEADKGTFSQETTSFLKGKTPAIVLAHNPLAFDLIDSDQDVLMLAGDTHGGQIPLPSWLWQVLGYTKNARYEQGLFEKGKKKMYVSRGIGTSHLPIRFLRPPEIVVLRFEGPAGG